MTTPDPTPPPAKPKKVQVNVRFPEALKDAIDERRREISPPGGPIISRDVWLARAAAFALAQHKPPTTAPGRRTAPPPHRRPQ